MDFIITVVTFILVIGFLILIHEGGHFFAARWAGVWVHEFAIGFGPAFWKRKTKETLYALRYFPVGGYVRMAGETVTSAEGGNNQETDPDAPKSDDPDKAAKPEDPQLDEDAMVPEDRMFSAKSPWARMWIIFAGPLTNIAGAILIMIFVTAAFGAPQIEIIDFTSDDSPAAQALEAGDIIATIEGETIYSTGQITSAIVNKGENPLKFGIVRNGDPMEVAVTPKWSPEGDRFLIGARFSIAQTNLITNLQDGAYLAKQGVQKGDRIVAINDMAVASSSTLNIAIDQLRESGEDSATMTVQRNGTPQTITLDLANNTVEHIFTGVGLEVPTRAFGFIESISVGTSQTWGMAVALYNGIRTVIRGEIAAGEAFSGPVGIANILRDGLDRGWTQFFFLVAFLSLNLGIFNLLPIPALDGSRIVFITIELVMGRPVPPRWEGLIHQIGFFLLIALIIVITYNDIWKLVQGFFGG